MSPLSPGPIRWRVKAQSRFGTVWIDRNGRSIVAMDQRGDRQSFNRIAVCVPEFRHALEDAADAWQACAEGQPHLRGGWNMSELKPPREHRQK